MEIGDFSIISTSGYWLIISVHPVFLRPHGRNLVVCYDNNLAFYIAILLFQEVYRFFCVFLTDFNVA